MRVEVYGASDDLIEVEGDLREEFTWMGDDTEAAVLAFGDGTILAVTYDAHGYWRIAPIHRGTAVLTLNLTAEQSYTDRAVLEGDVRWVVLGTHYVKEQT